VDQAELGVGKLLGGPCGYELEDTVVEEDLALGAASETRRDLDLLVRHRNAFGPA